MSKDDLVDRLVYSAPIAYQSIIDGVDAEYVHDAIMDAVLEINSRRSEIKLLKEQIRNGS